MIFVAVLLYLLGLIHAYSRGMEEVDQGCGSRSGQTVRALFWPIETGLIVSVGAAILSIEAGVGVYLKILGYFLKSPLSGKRLSRK